MNIKILFDLKSYKLEKVKYYVMSEIIFKFIRERREVAA